LLGKYSGLVFTGSAEQMDRGTTRVVRVIKLYLY